MENEKDELIAEMLQALKQSVPWLAKLSAENQDSQFIKRAFEKVETTIRKAEGR